MITIPGQPKGKGRPRHNGYVIYTPKETKEYEDLIRTIYRTKGKKFDGYVGVRIIAYRNIPKGKKIREDEWCDVKPDIDNIVKIILDGLNGEAFGDDRQVVYLEAEKKWSHDPRVVVQIGEVYDR